MRGGRMSYEDDQDEVHHLKGRLAMIEAENTELRRKLAERDQALQKIAFERTERSVHRTCTDDDDCFFTDGHAGPHSV